MRPNNDSTYMYDSLVFQQWTLTVVDKKLIYYIFYKNVITCTPWYRIETNIIHHWFYQEGGRVFGCHICDEQFSTSQEISKHLKQVHALKVPPGHVRFRYDLHHVCVACVLSTNVLIYDHVPWYHQTIIGIKASKINHSLLGTRHVTLVTSVRFSVAVKKMQIVTFLADCNLVWLSKFFENLIICIICYHSVDYWW